MMLQPRVCRPSQTIESSFNLLATTLTALTISTPKRSNVFLRHASHAAQGKANGPKDPAGRRLGAKKTALQFVIPGNIIFKQRGTKWHPGENVGIGKDHTIYATVSGYVRYYRDPFRHPERHFIGVALEREGPGSVLPTPRNAATRRRLGMYATPIQHPSGADDASWLEKHISAGSRMATPINQSSGVGGTGLTNVPPPATSGRPRYDMHRESNWSIGRTAEKKGIKVREYVRKDRWLAWRKRNQRIKRNALLKATKSSRKGKANKKKVQRQVAKAKP